MPEVESGWPAKLRSKVIDNGGFQATEQHTDAGEYPEGLVMETLFTVHHGT